MSSIQGQLLRLSTRRQVAIYRREERLWVADFIDGQGELMDATTWFRFHCGTEAATHARRRMVSESAIPISSQLVAKIERLHCSAATAEESPTLLPAVALATRGSGGRLARVLRKLFRRRATHEAVSTKSDAISAEMGIRRSSAT